MRLEGKNVVVTGAGSGIGRAAAVRFAAEGGRVIVVDLDTQSVEDTLGLLTGTGHRGVVGDVADAIAWDRIVDVAAGVDAAHLNAGVYGHTGPIDQLPLDTYRRTVAANIDGVVLGVRALVPALRASGGGSIVVTASAAGIVAFAGNPVYTLTKQAVAGFVRAVAPTLVADGIGIDAVCPGVVDTPMTVEALGGNEPDRATMPLIDPATIAAVALDLLTTEGTGRCRAVRERGGPVDWAFPDWVDLARAESNAPDPTA